MIKLSKLTDYALVMLHHMAQDPDMRLSAAALAAQTAIPEPTVAKILKLLAREGFVASTRGVNGGYALQKTPEAIRINDVIAAIEGPVAITACVDQGKGCARENRCALKKGWQVINRAINESLARVTLADMME